MSNKVLYTARATVTGGRDAGHARTDDGALEVDLRAPVALGGPGGGTNPEQLFAVGFAACFEGAVKVVARRMKVDADDVIIESAVDFLALPDRSFGVGVHMDVSLPSIDDVEQARAIVSAAHQVCPYSNATRGNIDVVFTVNGEAL